MDTDRTQWNQRYRGVSPPVAAAPEALVDRPDLIEELPTSGRALDIACGMGSQTLWLAHRGLDVVAVDVSDIALDRLRDAIRTNPPASSIDVRRNDLDQGLPHDLTDLDVIVCQRFRDTRLYTEIAARLRPGGIAVVTVLSAVGLDGDPGAFHAPEGELTEAFAPTDTDVLHSAERAGAASIVVRRR